MDIGTEHIFIINSSELNQHTTTPLQQDFRMPERKMEPGAPRDILEVTSICGLPQNNRSPLSRANMCRLCATITGMVVPIFEGEGLQNGLAEKIHQHLPLQVTPNDVLPVVLCFQCTSTLLAWHELAVCSVQADSAMRERFNLCFSSGQQQQEQPSIDPVQSQTKDDKCKPANVAEDTPGEPARVAAAPVDRCRSPSEFIAANDGSAGTPPPPRDAGAGGAPSATALDRSHLTSEDATSPDANRNRERNIGSRSSERETVRSEDGGGETENESTSRYQRASVVAMSVSGSQGGGGEGGGSPRRDEFSDRSDSESEFGRLPDAVLRAIEESSDGGEGPRAAAAPGRACPACGKACGSRSGWYRHRRRCGAPRSLPCERCGNTFAGRSELETHRRTHTKEKPFACRTCAARFGSRAGRYVHEQTHGGRRGHACARCGRAFRWRAALARHEARHEARLAGRRAHACAACGRGFAVAADLARHERSHRPGALPCALCGASFKQERYLKVHMENIHAARAAPAPARTPAPDGPRAATAD